MARHYTLTACYKNKYSFINEQELEIGESITSLEKMDEITCRYVGSGQLIDLLEKDGMVSGKNHLSITYTYNKERHHIPPLFNHPEMLTVIPNLKEVTEFKNNQPITYKIIPHDSYVFQEKLKEFYQLLGDEPALFFSEIYQDKAPKYLENLVYNYYNNKSKNSESLEDVYELQDLKEKIELEFSRYKIFREYLIYIDKYLKDHPNFIQKPIEENYSNNAKANTYIYDECDEEFLTSEEIEEMAKGDDLYHGPRRF